MLRYRLDRSTRHVVESYYWTLDGQWVRFPLGGMYPEIRVPALCQSERVYEYLRHELEPEGARVLEEAIEGIGSGEARPAQGGR